MKIAVTADIHYGTDTKKDELAAYLKNLNQNKVDILAVAGDLASRGASHVQFKEMLEVFAGFKGRVLFVPGNHDLWTKQDNSFHLLTEGIPKLIKGTNLHLLDNTPFIIGDLAFIGSVGWYDYSFRHVPLHISESFSHCYYRFEGIDTLFHFEHLTLQDYESKQCEVSWDLESWKKSTWQDKRFIKWEFNDYEFLDYCLNRLRFHIESVWDRVESIIALTHHLPFKEFVPDIPDPTWGFHRAYLGSEKIGELFLQYDKIAYAFFGHAHRNTHMNYNGIEAGNVFFGEEGGTRYLNL